MGNYKRTPIRIPLSVVSPIKSFKSPPFASKRAFLSLSRRTNGQRKKTRLAMCEPETFSVWFSIHDASRHRPPAPCILAGDVERRLCRQAFQRHISQAMLISLPTIERFLEEATDIRWVWLCRKKLTFHIIRHYPIEKDTLSHHNKQLHERIRQFGGTPRFSTWQCNSFMM